MTVYILKLANDEEMIATFDHELTDDVPVFVAQDPMSIIGMREDYGSYSGAGMRLRNALVMSDANSIAVRSRFVIAWYEPSAAMLKYYNAAVAYNHATSKDSVDQQIETAAEHLQKEAAQAKSRPATTADFSNEYDSTSGTGPQSMEAMMEEFKRMMSDDTPKNNKGRKLN